MRNPFRFIYMFATIFLIPLGALAEATQADFDLPAPPVGGSPVLQLWSTHYFVHRALPIPSGVAFRDKNDKLLSDPVSPKDWCLGAIEGTIQVPFQNDSKTLNFGGVGYKQQVDCAAVLKIDSAKKPWITSTGKSFFSAAKGPFGDGVQGNSLVPYRTIAVDKNVIPFGSVIFVPKARGATVKLPSGNVITHDGYFFAGDTGGAIKGQHIDVFCGSNSENCFPSFIMSDQNKRFDAILIRDPIIVSALQSRHKP